MKRIKEKANKTASENCPKNIFKQINNQLSGKKIFTKKTVCILCLIVTVLGLLFIASGTSYAILNGRISSENEQIIKAGNVTIALSEHYEEIDKKVSMLRDEEGLLQEDVYNFTIKNIGDITAKYDIKLINKVPSSYSGPIVEDKYVKVGLEINGEEHGPFTLEEVNNILDSGIITKNELIEYNLRIWLDAEYEDEILALEGAKNYYKIKVEAEQREKELEYGKKEVFNYTGDVQEYTVPYDGYYYIELQGAKGGEKKDSGLGGAGAFVSGYIKLSANEQLYFYVGGQGASCSQSTNNNSAGYNGGGEAGCGETYPGYGGGGATDVRLVNGEWNDTESLISRRMVAAGGGGGVERNSLKGGAGGAENGKSGQYYGEYGTSETYPTSLSDGGGYESGGESGEFTSTNTIQGTAGSFGKGGSGGYYKNSSGDLIDGAPGGGGGYYGGGGGTGRIASAGGGSSYISGYAGVNSVEESTDINHTAETLHYSGKYFIGIKALSGYNNNGNGTASITYYGTHKPTKLKNNVLSNVRYIRNCTNGNSYNTGNHITEFQAIKDGVNIAKNKEASWSEGGENATYPLENAVDGRLVTNGYAQGTGGVNDCLTIDLGETYSLDEIAVWHWSGNRGGRAYYHNTYVSSDGSDWKDAIVNEINTVSAGAFRYNAYHPEYNGYVYSDNLRLYYDGFANTGNSRSDSTTTWNDLTERDFDGTIENGKWNPTSLKFNGSSTWVDIFYTTWVNPTLQAVVSANTNSSLASSIIDNSQEGGYGLYLGNTGYYRMKAYVDGSYRYTPTEIKNEDGKIYSISGSYNGNELKFYSNGIDASSETNYNSTVTNTTNSTHLILGANPSGTSPAGNYLNGNIYSIRFYNRALTYDEVMHNYYVDQKKFYLYD